ncbi:unnamed protein product [[Actinomadura] parvosata subsp. kistnae]|nr:unnamed protein product [Actinomadura parvosata subsp. kistnae]
MHPGQQLHVGERLGQVVVGAQGQPVYQVLQRPRGGEHEDARLDVLPRGQDAADVVAVHAGQVTVENDHVVAVHGGQLQAPVTVAGEVHGQALGPQPLGENLGERGLVLDDQHPQRRLPLIPSATGRLPIQPGHRLAPG